MVAAVECSPNMFNGSSEVPLLEEKPQTIVPAAEDNTDHSIALVNLGGEANDSDYLETMEQSTNLKGCSKPDKNAVRPEQIPCQVTVPSWKVLNVLKCTARCILAK